MIAQNVSSAVFAKPPISGGSTPAGQFQGKQGQPGILNSSQDLTPEEQEQVRELQQRDQEVRAHEQAHKTAGGPYAGAISYETQTGPDGREYAVSGEVDIDASPVPDKPEATIRKMEVVIRAALAPSQPSAQDIQVARTAQQTKLEAQRELQEQRQAENQGSDESQGLQSASESFQALIKELEQSSSNDTDPGGRRIEAERAYRTGDQLTSTRIDISREQTQIIQSIANSGSLEDLFA